MEAYLNNIGNNTIRKNDYILADSYEIGDFSPEDMGDITGGVVAIIAPTNSGKTVLLKDIMSKTHKNYDKIHLFSRTAKLQHCYDFLPRKWITDDFNEGEIESIWDQQIKDNEQGKVQKKILIILDDIICSPSYKKSKILEECSISARHLNITVILLSQNYSSIKPIIRQNLRLVFTFQMQSKKEREKFTEAFLGADSSRAGDILLRRITDIKYQCLIVQVYKNGEILSNKVKKYIADPNVVIKLKDPNDLRGITKLNGDKYTLVSNDKLKEMDAALSSGITTPRLIIKKKKY